MTKMLRAVPVLPSTDVAASLAFMRDSLGFECWSWDDPPIYGGAARDGAELHFSATDRKEVCEWTSCRVDVDDVAAIYALAKAAGCVHPNGDLDDKPWGIREFAVLDPAGICITFGQKIGGD